MIEVSNLVKSYGKVKAVNSISFVVPKGEIVGFLGANGAGKTTTMDILCGVTGADEGTAKVCGKDILLSPVEAKRHIGYLPDEPPLYGEMRVHEFISFAATVNGVEKSMVKKAVAEAMDKLSLGQVKDRLISNLSKGFRQRVGLAQAIVHNPDVLILDEPTEGLDPSQIVQIRELIASLKGQHTILLSSHILSEVQNTCQRLIIIHKGKIIEEGTYDQILDRHQRENGCIVKPAKYDSSLADKLKGLDFVSGVNVINEDRFDISLRATQGENGLDRLLAYFVTNKVSLTSVSSKASSLEEIFIEITH